MTPIVGDVIESVLKNTIGKGVDALIGKYLPAAISESERENLKLEFVKAGMEQYKSEAEAIKSVNETMQSETKSEHWICWTWRPLVGFTYIATIVNNYVVVPYAKALGAGVEVIDIPSEIWLGMLAILGVAAYTRGTEKIARLKQ